MPNDVVLQYGNLKGIHFIKLLFFVVLTTLTKKASCFLNLKPTKSYEYTFKSFNSCSYCYFNNCTNKTSQQAAKVNSFYPFRFATKYSLFMRAIFSREIPLGHSTSQAPVLVQFPKPSSSICLTMFSTRSVASTCP